MEGDMVLNMPKRIRLAKLRKLPHDFDLGYGVTANGELMAEYSDFFKNYIALFNRGLKEPLDHSTRESLQCIVNYCYTDELELDENNLDVVAETARYLMMDFVTEKCLKYVEHIITPKVFDYEKLTEFNDDTVLLNLSEERLAFCFDEICRGREFQKLNRSQVAFLLHSSYFNVQPGMSMRQALEEWWQVDRLGRRKGLRCLIDFALGITAQQEAMEKQQEKIEERRKKGRRDVLLLMFDSNIKKHCTDELIDWNALPNRFHWLSATYLCDELIIAGDSDEQTIAETAYSFDLRTLQWMALAPLKTPRAGLCVAALDDVVYAIGGRNENGDDLATVERWDLEDRVWKTVASLRTKRSRASAVVVNGRLYVVGGLSGNTSLREVECYDMETNTWTDVAPLRKGHSQFGIAASNDAIYVVSGNTKSVERYEIALNNWFHDTSFFAPYSLTCLACAIFNSEILALFRTDTDMFILFKIERNRMIWIRELPANPLTRHGTPVFVVIPKFYDILSEVLKLPIKTLDQLGKVSKKSSGRSYQRRVDLCIASSLQLNEENVQAVFAAANALLLDDVVQRCIKYLIKQLQPLNCLRTRRLFAKYKFVEYQEVVNEFIYLRFEEVSQCTEFCELEAEDVKMILDSNKLNVISEDSVLRSVERWCEWDKSGRQYQLKGLLYQLEIQFLNKDKLAEYSKEVQRFFWKARGHYVFIAIEEHDREHNQDFNQKFKQYCYETEEWLDWLELPHKFYWCSAVYFDDVIIIVGGGSDFDAIVITRKASLEWETLKPPIPQRRDLCVVGLGRNVYTIGGQNERGDVATVERLDLWGTWMSVAPMQKGRTLVRAVALNGCLYVAGGYCNHRPMREVECYNPENDTWCYVAPMIRPHPIFEIAASEDAIYVLGGNSETVERYDPKANSWIVVTRIPFSYIGLNCAYFDDRLWVMRANSMTEEGIMFQYDPERKEWTELKASNSCFRACTTFAIQKAYLDIDRKVDRKVDSDWDSDGSMYF